MTHHLLRLLLVLVLTGCGSEGVSSQTPEPEPVIQGCPSVAEPLPPNPECWAVYDDCAHTCKVFHPGDVAVLVIPGRMVQIACDGSCQ